MAFTVVFLVNPPKLPEDMDKIIGKLALYAIVKQYPMNLAHFNSGVICLTMAAPAIDTAKFHAIQYVRLFLKYVLPPVAISTKTSWNTDPSICTSRVLSVLKPMPLITIDPNPWTPPLAICALIWIVKSSQALMSVRASMHWFHLKVSLLMPVMFSATRSMALMRSASLRNRALVGVSGRRKKIVKDQAVVMPPKMRKTA